MRKTIDLNRAAATADAKAFEAAVKTNDGVNVGAGSFTTSGQDKNAAPVRPRLAADGFAASGGGKVPDIAGDDFTATGGGKDERRSISGVDFTATGGGKNEN